MSNFSLNHMLYRLLRLYNDGVICYEKNVLRPWKQFHSSMYNGSILQITYYNTFDMTKRVMYNKSWYAFACDMYNMLNGKSIKKKVVHEGLLTNQPHNILPIYEIVCWDGRRYLTRDRFDIEHRNIRQERHLCLHASLNDVYDLTPFVNAYPTSFNSENNIQLIDIMCMALLDAKITYDEFYKLLDDKSDNFFYVIDDQTLEVRTFKDNDIIIL